MLTISEHAVLKAVAEGEDVKGAADVAIIDKLINRGLIQFKYVATELGKDELNTAEENRMRG